MMYPTGAYVESFWTLGGIASPGVSNAGQAKGYYDRSANKLYASLNGGAYLQILRDGDVTVTLQGAYDGATGTGTGGGRTLNNMGGGAVQFVNQAANANDVFQVQKLPGAALAGHGVVVQVGANAAADATGSAIVADYRSLAGGSIVQVKNTSFATQTLAAQLTGVAVDLSSAQHGNQALIGASVSLPATSSSSARGFKVSTLQTAGAAFEAEITSASGTVDAFKATMSQTGAGSAVSATMGSSTTSPMFTGTSTSTAATIPGLSITGPQSSIAKAASQGLAMIFARHRRARTLGLQVRNKSAVLLATGSAGGMGSIMSIGWDTTNFEGNTASSILDDQTVMLTLDGISNVDASTNNVDFRGIFVRIPQTTNSSTRGVKVSTVQEGGYAYEADLTSVSSGDPGGFHADLSTSLGSGSAFRASVGASTYGFSAVLDQNGVGNGSSLVYAIDQTATAAGARNNYVGRFVRGPSFTSNGSFAAAAVLIENTPSVLGGTLTLNQPVLSISHAPTVAVGACTDTSIGAQISMTPATASTGTQTLTLLHGATVTGGTRANVSWSASATLSAATTLMLLDASTNVVGGSQAVTGLRVATPQTTSSSARGVYVDHSQAVSTSGGAVTYQGYGLNVVNSVAVSGATNNYTWSGSLVYVLHSNSGSRTVDSGKMLEVLYSPSAPSTAGSSTATGLHLTMNAMPLGTANSALSGAYVRLDENGGDYLLNSSYVATFDYRGRRGTAAGTGLVNIVTNYNGTMTGGVTFLEMGFDTATTALGGDLLGLNMSFLSNLTPGAQRIRGLVISAGASSAVNSAAIDIATTFTGAGAAGILVDMSPGSSGSVYGMSITMGANTGVRPAIYISNASTQSAADSYCLAMSSNGAGARRGGLGAFYGSSTSSAGAFNVNTMSTGYTYDGSTLTAVTNMSGTHPYRTALLERAGTFTSTGTYSYPVVAIQNNAIVNSGGATLTLNQALLAIQHAPTRTAGTLTDTSTGLLITVSPAVAASAVMGATITMSDNASGVSAYGLQVGWTAPSNNYNHLRLQQSTSGHGMTDLVPTDVFFSAGPNSTTNGGGYLAGWSDDAATSAAILAGNMATASSSVAAVSIDGWKKSGATRAAMVTTDLVLSVRAGTTSLIMVNAAGVQMFGGTGTAYGRVGQLLEVNVSATYGGAALTTWSTTDAENAVLDFNKSGAASIGTYTAVASGEALGTLAWRGADGTQFAQGAAIIGYADAAWSAGDNKGRVVISTNSGASTDEVVRFNSSGGISIGSTAAAAATRGMIQWGTGLTFAATTPQILGPSDTTMFVSAGAATGSSAGRGLTLTGGAASTDGAGGTVTVTGGAAASGGTARAGGGLTVVTGAGAGGATGGAAGSVVVNFGAPAAGTTVIGGAGGTITINATTGGNGTGTAGSGGKGSCLAATFGDGGAATASDGGTGGIGGDCILTGGAGGATAGNASTGGIAGRFAWFGSAAGAATNGTAGTGGAGGSSVSINGTTRAANFYVTTSAGGASTAGTGGLPGSFITVLGNAGSSGGGGNVDGAVFLVKFGTRTASGSHGGFYLHGSDETSLFSVTNGNAILVGATGGSIGFLGASASTRQTGGENVTNNVTDSGSTAGTIPDITDGTTYSNDYTNLRRALYQLARMLKQDHDALRLYGLLT